MLSRRTVEFRCFDLERLADEGVDPLLHRWIASPHVPLSRQTEARGRSALITGRSSVP